MRKFIAIALSIIMALSTFLGAVVMAYAADAETAASAMAASASSGSAAGTEETVSTDALSTEKAAGQEQGTAAGSATEEKAGSEDSASADASASSTAPAETKSAEAASSGSAKSGTVASGGAEETPAAAATTAASASTQDSGDAAAQEEKAAPAAAKAMAPAAAAATDSDLSGTAYAVLNTTSGELDFIRSTETHDSGSTGTVKSISGGSYTGKIYTGFEERLITYIYNNTPWYADRASVKTVKFVDAVKPVATACWFYEMANCTSMDLAKLDTSSSISMNGMFNKCSSLKALDLSGFVTTNVTDMYGMFTNCSSLTTLDLYMFDTSKVTDMNSMFSGCSGLASLSITGFNTANVTDMGYMFNGCSSLKALDVSKFDTAKVTNMASMFSGCKGLASLDVSGFNTASVTNMKSMFMGCSKLTTLKIGPSFSIASGADTTSMFPTPTATASGKTSTGTWGLGSEHAEKAYSAADLATYGAATAGALNGTWYAQSTAAYTIAFAANAPAGEYEGTTASVSAVYGTAQTLPANGFAYAGYDFTGWNTKADGSGTTYADKASVKDLSSTDGATVTLYAQWRPKTYSIVYDANGGQGSMASGSIAEGHATTLEKSTFTRKGYRFKGWNTKPDGSGISYADQQTVKDITGELLTNAQQKGIGWKNGWANGQNGVYTTADDIRTYLGKYGYEQPGRDFSLRALPIDSGKQCKIVCLSAATSEAQSPAAAGFLGLLNGASYRAEPSPYLSPSAASAWTRQAKVYTQPSGSKDTVYPWLQVAGWPTYYTKYDGTNGVGGWYRADISVRDMTQTSTTLYAQWEFEPVVVKVPKAVTYAGMDVGTVDEKASYDVSVTSDAGQSVTVAGTVSVPKCGSDALGATAASAESPIVFTSSGTKQDTVTLFGTARYAGRYQGYVQYSIEVK